MRKSSIVAVVLFSSSAALGDDAGVPRGDASVARPDGGAPSADAGVADAAIGGRPVADGDFALVDPSAVDASVDAAIDAAIRGLHPSMRDAFRSQLRATLRFPRVVRVARGPETHTLTWDGTRFEAPASGAERRQTGPEGRPLQIALRDESGTFLALFRTSGFTRQNHFVGADAGMQMHVELRSGLLRAPVVVSATYARRAP